MGQCIGDCLHSVYGARSEARVTVKQNGCPGIPNGTALPKNGGKRGDVTEPEIDALSGERMDAMRGVPDQRDSMRDDHGQLQERERESGGRR